MGLIFFRKQLQEGTHFVFIRRSHWFWLVHSLGRGAGGGGEGARRAEKPPRDAGRGEAARKEREKVCLTFKFTRLPGA